MPSSSRSIVYSLLTAVFVLLLGMMTMLSVANQRHQRLEDQTVDLQRNLSQQERQIEALQGRLENCDTLLQKSSSMDISTRLPPVQQGTL